MRWCSLQTNEHDLQAIMYPIICKYHRLNINNRNKVPVFPGYICNRWQNMIVQPSQTHNHGKIWQQWDDIFPLISTIVILNVLTLCFPVYLIRLAVIHWNSYAALKCQGERIDVSQLYKLMVAMEVDKHVKHTYFIVTADKWTILLQLCLHWVFDNKCCTLRRVYNKINIKSPKERGWCFKYIKRTLHQIPLWLQMAPHRRATIVYISTLHRLFLGYLRLCEFRAQHQIYFSQTV